VRKKKQQNLDKQIKEREIDSQILQEKKEAENEIGELKSELKMEIEMKRDQMKRKISEMRKKSRRRKALMQSKMNKIRTQMANDIMMANKEGDIRFCKKGKKDLKERDTYCNANFIDNFVLNYDCKNDENFCYMCCENEFGSQFYMERNGCYDMCDGKAPKKKIKKKKKKKVVPPGLDDKKKSKKKGPRSNKRTRRRKKKTKVVGGWIWRPRAKPLVKVSPNN